MGDEHGTAHDEEFGVRVSHQSEAVRLEAAEFLVATRSQHEGQVRAARQLDALRGHEETTP